jgi:hypothetical protein
MIRARNALCTVALAAALYLNASPGFSAAADDNKSGTPGENNAVGTITVEGKRDRATVEKQADTFVSRVIVHPFDESLARWRTPVCPLVFGVSRDNGEYLLEKLSQIARNVGVPLAGEKCRANFYIVMTPEPDALLKAWSKRDVTMFGDAGSRQVSKFKQAAAPIRVWYNLSLDNADGTSLSDASPGLALSGGSADGAGAFNGIPTNNHAIATRLAWNEVRDLASAIVLIDTRKAIGIKYNQLTAYIAMAAFAEVRLDGDVGSIPTVLSLFKPGANTAPPGLSEWDEALLKALYRTEQTDKGQLGEVRLSVAQTMLH